MAMPVDLPLPMRQTTSLLYMQRLIGSCLVLILLTIPFWLDSAHSTEMLDADRMLHAPLTAEPAGGLPDDAPSAVHCALHCAPQVLFPTFLLYAFLLPLASPALPASTRFHMRLGAAPPLPPPRTS